MKLPGLNSKAIRRIAISLSTMQEYVLIDLAVNGHQPASDFHGGILKVLKREGLIEVRGDTWGDIELDVEVYLTEAGTELATSLIDDPDVEISRDWIW